MDDFIVYVYYIALAYVAFFFLYFIVICFRDIYLKSKMEKGFVSTLDYNDSLGSLVSVSGSIGSGKTTSTAGLMQCFELTAYRRIQQELDEFSKLLYEFDLNVINQQIISAYYEKKSRFELLDSILSLIADELKNKVLGYGTTKYSLSKLIELYIDRNYVLLDSNYLISNTSIYSILTSSYAKVLDMKYLHLKVQYELSKDKGYTEYPLRNYTCIGIDEVNLDTFKKGSNFFSVAKEDLGMDILERLSRNMFRGTTRIYFIMQNVERYVKEEREIFVSNLVVNGFNIIDVHKAKSILLFIVSSVVKIFYSLFTFIFHNRHKEYYRNSKNKFRSILYKLLIEQYKLFSDSYIVYPVKNYSQVKYLGKENTPTEQYYENFDLVFPIMYCFGTTDSYFYEFVQEELEKKSRIRMTDLEEFVMSSDYQDSFKQKLLSSILEKKYNSKSAVASAVEKDEPTHIV